MSHDINYAETDTQQFCAYSTIVRKYVNNFFNCERYFLIIKI